MFFGFGQSDLDWAALFYGRAAERNVPICGRRLAASRVRLRLPHLITQAAYGSFPAEAGALKKNGYKPQITPAKYHKSLRQNTTNHLKSIFEWSIILLHGGVPDGVQRKDC